MKKLIISLLCVTLFLMTVHSCDDNSKFKLTPNPEVNIDSLVIKYRTFHERFPSRKVSKSSKPYILENDLRDMPQKIKLLSARKTVKQWVNDFIITGLAVSHNDKIVFEQYYRGNQANSQTIAFSVTKSVVSALVGIAYQDRLIKNINDPIDEYVPEFIDSGWEGVSIKDILQMASGIRYNEKFEHKDDDGSLFFSALRKDGLDSFIISLQKDIDAGTKWNYQNVNTQALAMLLRKVTGKSLSEYLYEKIWQPAGMEFDAYFRLDPYGVEFAPGHFTMTLRDRLRFGLLYLHNGMLNGQQIIQPQWIQESHTPDASYLQPNEKNEKMGYGYQFWIPFKDIGEDDYLAIGLEGQFIYINPSRNVVIAVSAAFPDNGKYGLFVYQMVEVFRQIAKHYG